MEKKRVGVTGWKKGRKRICSWGRMKSNREDGNGINTLEEKKKEQKREKKSKGEKKEREKEKNEKNWWRDIDGETPYVWKKEKKRRNRNGNKRRNNNGNKGKKEGMKM